MNTVHAALDVLESVDTGVPSKDRVFNVISALKSVRKLLHDRNHAKDELISETPVGNEAVEQELHTIKALFTRTVAPQVEKLLGEKGVSVLKKNVDSIVQTDRYFLYGESTEDTLSQPLKSHFLNDMIEAERAMSQAVIEKARFSKELESVTAETIFSKHQILIPFAAKFYHDVITAKLALLQAQQSLQCMVVRAGSSLPTKLKQVLTRIHELDLIMNELEITQNNVVHSLIRIVIGPDLMQLRESFIESKNAVDNIRTAVFEMEEPLHETSHIKLKQHVYKESLFKKKSTPSQKTIIKQVEDGTTVPIGDSLSHVYLKPSRDESQCRFFAKHYPPPSEGTTVAIYASVPLSKMD